MKIYKIWLSGLVRRWHSNPDLAHTAQTNAQHQWGCAILAIYLFPDNHRLLIGAITHDAGEVGIGDVTGPAKRRDPVLKAASEAAESSNFLELELIEPMKTLELSLIDMLEAYIWAERHAPHTLSTDDWPEVLEKIKELARHFRVYDKVCACIKNF
jgi:5'-deoxynucleotidase YfbR-like HD superfamily hydrolase